jgi:septal ring factor EnvC (AmiA/AmiB activator)
MLSRATPSVQTSFGAMHGKLPWPTVGSLAGRFGDTVDPGLGTTSRQGIAIDAVVGDVVQAVAAGRVVFAGWMRGYGQMVVLDHGEHYHTVVAQLGQIAVHAGEQVSAGAEIGRVGESGWQGGLVFELHRAGVAIDPLPWLKR